MKEKKQFFIPKNYDKKFEWIPGISGWQHLAFVPIVVIDYFAMKYTNFSFSNKATFIAISLGLPWVMIGTHPVRENVPLYKHLYWKLRFLNRQRLFHYRKEGYVNESNQQIENKPTKAESKGSKKAADCEKFDTRFNSLESNPKRVAHHSRQQNGSVPKSVGH